MLRLLSLAILAFSLLMRWPMSLFRDHNAVLAENPPPASPRFVYLPFIQRANPACVPSELVQDGGFEAGLPNPFWQTSSNVSSDILDDTSDPPPHSGQWKAWLGGDDQVQESLWQVITISVDANSLQLSYWWQVSTLETTHPFDMLMVQIRDAQGNPLETLETLTDGDATSNWQQSILPVTTSYAGQTVQLAFVVETDDTNPTSFFLDDIGVLQRCP